MGRQMAFDPFFPRSNGHLNLAERPFWGFWEPLCGASERSCDISPKGSLQGVPNTPKDFWCQLSCYISGVDHRNRDIKAFHGGTATSTLGPNMSRDFQKSTGRSIYHNFGVVCWSKTISINSLMLLKYLSHSGCTLLYMTIDN